jgi:hypothetical protein
VDPLAADGDASAPVDRIVLAFAPTFMEGTAFGLNLDCRPACNVSTCLPHPNRGIQCTDPSGVTREDAVSDMIAYVQKNILVVDGGDFDPAAHIAAKELDFLIEITRYDGHDDDQDVGVAFYVSNGIDPTIDGGTALGWALDPRHVARAADGGAAPLYVARRAYVSGGRLVALFDHLAVPVAFGTGLGVVVTSEATIDAPLSRSGDGGIAIGGGSLAARVTTGALLTTIGKTFDPLYNVLHCAPIEPNYFILREHVCQFADLAHSSKNDDSTPLSLCDALSYAARFDAIPAVLGHESAASDASADAPTCFGDANWSDDCDPFDAAPP